MIFALESWSFGFLAGAPGLPPIDWSAFGEDAEAIRTQAAELMGEWKAAAARSSETTKGANNDFDQPARAMEVMLGN